MHSIDITNDNDTEIVFNIQDEQVMLGALRIMEYGKETTAGSTMMSIETTTITNATLVTDLSSTTTTIAATTSSSTTAELTISPASGPCPNLSDQRLPNGTCVTAIEAQKEAVSIFRNSSSSSSQKAEALLLYFRSTTDLTTSLNTSNILTPREIDVAIDELNDIIETNQSTAFIMVQPTIKGNTTILGVALQQGGKHVIIKNTPETSIANLNISAAAIISDESLNNINSITIFMLDNPIAYANLDNTSNQSLVSSVIVASVRRKVVPSPVKIQLYFQVLNNTNSYIDGQYLCSFYDTNASRWDESGCTEPLYNGKDDRYECSCNHLTTFALIWLPKTPLTNYLNAQDIASLTFLSISIVCFAAVIIHSLTTRLRNSIVSVEARDLLPLISSASTTILFIFFIALAMTVYTRIPSPYPTRCFTSSSVLMFFVYFFLIFMFCAKTSVGYFNYLRFVHLFPEPSYRKLYIMLIISFVISITWVSFTAGFNSNPNFNTTQLYSNKLCWFTPNVIYYYMTIPVCLFLLLNFITIVFIAKRIIIHARNATSPHQSYERMKRCVLVLLSSCVTQGVGWLFGPFISFVNPTAGDVLGWFFIIFNGLEGVWTILLYMIIRAQRMDESKRGTIINESRTNTLLSSDTNENEREVSLNSMLVRRFQRTDRNVRKEPPVFDDLYNVQTIDWDTSSYQA